MEEKNEVDMVIEVQYFSILIIENLDSIKIHSIAEGLPYSIVANNNKSFQIKYGFNRIITPMK